MMHDHDYEMTQADEGVILPKEWKNYFDSLLEKNASMRAERDEARAQLANAAASEVDAVQGRQECEAELREARKWNETLEDALQSIADVAERDMNEGRQGWGTQEIAEIARGVLEGF